MSLLKDPVAIVSNGKARVIEDYALDKVILTSAVSVIFALWIVAGVFVLLDEDTVWSKWEGWLDWGRNFAFVTVMPYLGKKLAQGIENGGGTPEVIENGEGTPEVKENGGGTPERKSRISRIT